MSSRLISSPILRPRSTLISQLHYPPPRDELIDMGLEELRRHEARLSQEIAHEQAVYEENLGSLRALADLLPVVGFRVRCGVMAGGPLGCEGDRGEGGGGLIGVRGAVVRISGCACVCNACAPAPSHLPSQFAISSFV